MERTIRPGRLRSEEGEQGDEEGAAGLENDGMSVRPGRYRHYKGNDYTVIGIARHSETQEELVVYRQEYGDNGLWVRPLAMFVETVEVDGKLVARFERMEEEG